MKRWWWILVGAVIASGIVLALVLRGQSARDADDMGPLEIGHETTRIVEPLRDGRVDYLAALNAVQAPDADDNAAIPLLRVFGTDALIGDVRDVLLRIGAPDGLPASGSFVPAPEDVADELGNVEFESDLERSDDEIEAGRVLIAEWLASNRDALDGLVDASRRPRLWWPVARNEEGLIGRALPVASMRAATEALAARAEIARASGNVREGWADVAALLRLHGLIDQLHGSLCRLIANGCHQLAMDWWKKTLETAPPDATLTSEVLQVLAAVPRPRGVALDVEFDRLTTLDLFIRNSGGGVGLNPALRAANRGIDEIMPLLEQPDSESAERITQIVEARVARARALGDGLQQLLGKVGFVGETVATGGASVSRFSGDALATMVLAIVPITLNRVHHSESRRHVAAVAAALRLHALRTGSFPDTLEALVPDTLPALPVSALGGSGVPYARTDGGCRVGDEDWAIALAR